MKNIKKNCIVIATLSIIGMSVNAQTLVEALTNGKFNAEIRSTTVLSSSTDAKEASINNNAKASSIGLQFNYKSADLNGFNIGLGFQTAHDLNLHEKEISKTGPKGEDEPRTTVSRTNMYVGYLGYNRGTTNIKVGRQIIMTPLMANSNTFPLRDSFHGLSIINKDLPKTELKLFAIKDWYERYHAEDGNSRVTHFEKPLYSLYVKNSSIERLTLEGQYLSTTSEIATNDTPLTIDGGYSTYYGAFDYKLPTSHPLSLGAFYAGAKYDKAHEDSTNFYGVKIGTKLPYLGVVKLAYTEVDDNNNFPGALGHVPHFFKYNGGEMFTDNFFAGLSATSILVIPNFKIPGVKTLFSYALYSQSNKGIENSSSFSTTGTHNMDGASELQVDIRYQFSGRLKGFSTRLQLAYIDYDNESVKDDDLITSRIYLSYKF